MLEEILAQYKGTLVIVSHDRDFLDQTVTKILAFEGEGKIEMHIGGYSDYLEAKEKEKNVEDKPRQYNTQTKPKAAIKETKETSETESKPGKLSYKLERELALLPAEIEKAQNQVQKLREVLEDPDLFQRDQDAFYKATDQLTEWGGKLDDLETRWIELEEMKLNAGS